MSEAQRKGDLVKLLAVGGALAGGGYIAYRYWYLPAKMREDAQRFLQQNSYRPDAFASLGGVACQALGAKYGMPPQASAGICSEVGQAAAQLVREFPALVGGTLQSVGTGVGQIGIGVGTAVGGIGQGAGMAIGGVGSGIGQATSSIAGGAASGLVQLGTVPIQVVSKTVGTVYSGAKTVVTDVAKGLGSGVRQVTRFFGSLF